MQFVTSYKTNSCATIGSSDSNFSFLSFSSRRRHTTYIGDWSSAVCSSDLERIWLDGLLEQSPSLKIKLANELPVYYAEAVRLAMAMARTAVDRERFPAECPFTVEQILDS